MERLFVRIYDFFASRRRLAVVIPLLLSLVFIFAAARVDFSEDIAGFLPYGSGKSHRQSQFVYKNLRMADRIAVVFSADGFASQERVDFLSSAADDFVDRFWSADVPGAKDPQLGVDALGFLGTAGFIVSNMPYFLSDEDYDRIDSILSAGNFDEIFEKNRETIVSSDGYFAQGIIVSDPFHISASLLEKLSRIGMKSGYTVIGDYIFTADSSMIIMSLASEYGGSETRRNALLTAKIRELADSTMASNKGLEISFLGSPVIAVANARRMSSDAMRCAVLSLALIVLLLIWYFRGVKPILLICLPLIFGILTGLGFMGLLAPDMSSVALSASCVIFGIGVDYALLYSTRLGFVRDPRTALKDIVSPMVVGNITTVGAFLSLLVMSAAGMRDFGLFAAVSLVGTILFVILFLPHWIRITDGGASYRSREDGWLAKWVNLSFENYRFIPPAVLLLSVLFFVFGMNVGFSGDLSRINYMDEAQKRSLEDFERHGDSSGNIAVYAVAQGESIDEALDSYESMLPFAEYAFSEGISAGISGIGCFLPSSAMQTRRIERWNRWRDANRERLLGILDEYSPAAGFSSGAFEPFKALLDRDFEVRPESFFAPAVSLLNGYIMRDTTGKAMIMTVLHTPEQNIPEIYDLFEKFMASRTASAADPSAAGSGIHGSAGSEEPFLFDSYSMTGEMISVLRTDFDRVLFICSCLVFVFLWMALGRLELALTAFFPMALSWIWITGLMGIFGVEFNIVNIILATFIFGLGDDYTIFMVEGLSYEYATGRKLLDSYKTGVTLSAVTMFMGIGSLVLALHPALRSLGEVAVIGMVCVVAMAFLLPPFIFSWMTKYRRDGVRHNRYIPVRISDIFVTLFCGLVFSVSCICLKIAVMISPLFGDGTDGGRFRYTVFRLMRYCSAHMPRVRMIVRGALETDTPVLITCNHQSHLDLMYLLGLSPKIVVLTNRWTYNSPVYGDIVRKLGFICVQESFEEQLPAIKEAVRKGYSIAVFPEGTRSGDCSVRTFHSGALHIAQRLGLDILPVIVHGIGHVLPKGDHILRPGSVTISVGTRIPNSGLHTLGARPLKMAKGLERYYRAGYESLRRECETLEYIENRVKGLYMYKGTGLQKLVGRQFRELRESGIEAKAAALPQGAEIISEARGTGLEGVIYAILRYDIKSAVCVSEDAFERSVVEVIAGEFGGRLYVKE